MNYRGSGLDAWLTVCLWKQQRRLYYWLAGAEPDGPLTASGMILSLASDDTYLLFDSST